MVCGHMFMLCGSSLYKNRYIYFHSNKLKGHLEIGGHFFDRPTQARPTTNPPSLKNIYKSAKRFHLTFHLIYNHPQPTTHNPQTMSEFDFVSSKHLFSSLYDTRSCPMFAPPHLPPAQPLTLPFPQTPPPQTRTKPSNTVAISTPTSFDTVPKHWCGNCKTVPPSPTHNTPSFVTTRCPC